MTKKICLDKFKFSSSSSSSTSSTFHVERHRTNNTHHITIMTRSREGKVSRTSSDCCYDLASEINPNFRLTPLSSTLGMELADGWDVKESCDSDNSRGCVGTSEQMTKHNIKFFRPHFPSSFLVAASSLASRSVRDRKCGLIRYHSNKS